jgi:hypothetical protein
MPVRQYAPSRTAQYAELVGRLAEEWANPQVAAAEPVILEEPDGRGTLRHVYVVWSDWSALPRETRGEVIMDAAARVKPQPDVLDITIAMGLTPDEADRFDLQWR